MISKYNDQEALCLGLRKGVANCHSDDKPVNAREAVRYRDSNNGKTSLPLFYCPECYSDAGVRDCSRIDDHFFHIAKISDVYRQQDIEFHKACQTEICDSLIERYPRGNWRTEVVFPEDKDKGLDKVVADIVGFMGSEEGQSPRVVIEIQRSYMTYKRIIKRTLQYSKRGIYILWIVPLKDRLSGEFYRPRIFERFLHTMYFNRLYYWVKGMGRFVDAVHLDKATRIMESKTYFNESGEEVTTAEWVKVYKTLKKPNFQCLLDIAEFKAGDHKEYLAFKKKNIYVPQRLGFKDTLKKWWSKDNEVTHADDYLPDAEYYASIEPDDDSIVPDSFVELTVQSFKEDLEEQYPSFMLKNADDLEEANEKARRDAINDYNEEYTRQDYLSNKRLFDATEKLNLETVQKSTVEQYLISLSDFYRDIPDECLTKEDKEDYSNLITFLFKCDENYPEYGTFSQIKTHAVELINDLLFKLRGVRDFRPKEIIE